MNEKRICGLCRYFNQKDDGDEGHCQRHAPKPLVVHAREGVESDAYFVLFPIMHKDHGCGEHDWANMGKWDSTGNE